MSRDLSENIETELQSPQTRPCDQLPRKEIKPKPRCFTRPYVHELPRKDIKAPCGVSDLSLSTRILILKQEKCSMQKKHISLLRVMLPTSTEYVRPSALKSRPNRLGSHGKASSSSRVASTRDDGSLPMESHAGPCIDARQ